MIIKRLRATFGALNGREMELSDGLNIIEAPNESGKSTWCAFLRAMLYGINTSARDKNSALAAKTRYRPWSGALMEGEMDVSDGGSYITLRRTGTAASPMKRFSAVYTGTGDELSVSGADIGEMLTGVPEAVFERTAFIKQSGMRVDGASELEKRINSLVSSGEEQTSFAEADDRLRAWKNAYGRSKTGVISRLEERKAAIAERAEALQKGTDALADARSEVERLESFCESFRKDLKTHAILERRAEATRVMDAKKAYAEASAAYDTAEREAEKYSAATPERKNEIRNAFAAYEAVLPVCERERENCAAAEKAAGLCEEERKKSPLAAFSETEASEMADRAGNLQKSSEEEKALFEKAVRTHRIMAVCLAVFCLIAAVIFGRKVPLYIIAPAMAVIVVLFFLLKKPKLNTKAENELRTLLSGCGFEDVAALISAVGKYREMCAACHSADAVLDGARAGLSAAEDAMKKSAERKSRAVSEAFPWAEDFSDINGLLAEADAAAEKLSQAGFARASAMEVYESLSAAFGEDPEKTDFSLLIPPSRGRAETEAALLQAEKLLAQAKSTLDMRTGELSALGAPELISGEASRLERESAEAGEKYAALLIASETLADADAEMRNRCSPIISRRAGEILSHLTESRYERLTFDRTFGAETRMKGDTLSRSALFVSAGTENQIYLALRLAMCELLLPDGKCPIILDDALTNFDDARALLALETLAETAKTRQILLFTCHSRERALTADREDINVIRL